MNSRLIASMLVRRDGEYLFIRQNKPGGAYPDSLHIPGGGLEPDETPLEAAVREVREEVGVEVTNVEAVDFDWDVVLYKGTDTLLIFLRFVGEYLSGDAVPASDAKEVIWVRESDLTKFPQNKPTLSLLARLSLL
ncbi:MAG: NUDIX domain-containing protein [Frankiaceae bacterium]